jgi:hypothetical protein
MLVSPTLASRCPRLTSVRVRSVRVRVSRVPARPTSLPALLPTKPRVVVFGSRTPATFSVDLPAMLSEPIVRPIRDGRSPWRRREASPGESPRPAADRIGVGAVREPPVRVADCSFWVTILLSFCKMGSLPPIRLPIRELRSVRGVERLFIPRTPDELVFRGFELTAGCLACPGAEEFRVPIVPPIRERRLVLDWLVTFETDDRPLESFLLESLLERAAG